MIYAEKAADRFSATPDVGQTFGAAPYRLPFGGDP
jgi:hypothetical protein